MGESIAQENLERKVLGRTLSIGHSYFLHHAIVILGSI
jgi:hypothetical protein